MLVAASILAADLARLGDEVDAAQQAGADWIHFDAMDGRFVPNLTFGPLVVEAIRRHTSLPIDVHLMIEEPERLVPEFVRAGADYVTIHVESTRHLHRALALVRECGAGAGVTLNPATPLALLQPVLPDVDLVLVMSVIPGFGGQRFIPASADRVAGARAMLTAVGSPAHLSVDGGISASTAPLVVRAGATVLVAGSAIFGNPAGLAAGISALRTAANPVIPGADPQPT